MTCPLKNLKATCLQYQPLHLPVAAGIVKVVGVLSSKAARDSVETSSCFGSKQPNSRLHPLFQGDKINFCERISTWPVWPVYHMGPT